MRFVRNLVLLSVLCVLSGVSAYRANGQSAASGAIFGTVTDKSSAILVGAKVVVTNEDTGSSKELTTNGTGYYSFEALPSANYRVVVTKEGFESADIQHIHLDPGQRREVSSQLNVGNVNTSVTVEESQLSIKTETSENSSTIGAKEIQTLLVNGRNFQSLATLSPGVNNTSGNNQYTGGGTNLTLSIGGTGTDNTTYAVDGIYNMNTGSYDSLNITPSMDAISEFTVLKSNFSARYGTSSSSLVLVDTKSGTSTYHGAAWDYFRNDALDASNYYSEGQKSELRQNIYGFTFGGPLQIPKLYNRDRKKQTFFFASVEWWSKTIGSTRTTNVFTPDMRNGNLTGSRGLPAALTISPDGAQLLAAEGKTNCIASPTSLDQSCIDPGAIALLKQYQPLPNASNPQFNYVNNVPDTWAQIDHDYRGDHNFSSTETLTARLMYEEDNSGQSAATWGGGNVPTISTNIYTSAFNGLVRLTSQLTPTIVNSASIAETYDKPRLNVSKSPIPTGLSIGYYYPNANVTDQVPNISVADYEGFGGGGLPITASDGEGIINDDFSIVKGKHTLQAGGFYLFGIKNQSTGNTPWGSFTFDGHYTGSGAADFLLGLHHGFSQDSAKPLYSAHYRSTEFYFQDDWKATPRLTINAGIRFFYFSPDWLTGADRKTSNLELSRFVADAAPVVLPDGSFQTNLSGVPITAGGGVANLQNGLVFNTDPGTPRGFFNSSAVHPSPRIGFAYVLTRDGRTSVHGGYGMGYTRVPFRIADAFGSNPPGVANANFVSGTLENPTAGTQSANVARPQGINIVNPVKGTEVQSFSLIGEREVVRDGIFQVGYAGSLGRHLRVGVDENQPLPTSNPYSTTCLSGQSASVTYDFDPCLNTGTISEDFVRPYQGYSGLSAYAYEGNSNYHSLQSQFKLTRSHVQTTINYTYEKALGDASNRGGDYRTQFSGTQNSYDITKEYGPLNFDRTHIFSGEAIYTLPELTRGHNKFVQQALGGWSISGIALAQSGLPFSPGLSAPNTGLAGRPNQVGHLHQDKGNRQGIFNPDAFEIPAYGFFGTASNGSIRGPKEVAFNTAIYKTFPIRERLKFQFRAEAFNIANHPSFAGVNTGIGPFDPQVGWVNSPRDPRIMEMVGRITF